MKIKKNISISAFSLVIGVAIFMGNQGEVLAKNCTDLENEAKQLQLTYKNDMEYLDEEGEALAGHDVVKAIKQNIPVITREFNAIKTQYRKQKCSPPGPVLGTISTLYDN